MDVSSPAPARDQFWSVTAAPALLAHPSWLDGLSAWPVQARFTEQAIHKTPADLLKVFSADRDRFSRLLEGAGFVQFAPAIRRVISRGQLSDLNALLGPARMAQLVALKPDLALPDELSPSSVAPLLTKGMETARHAGIGLLASCTNSLDSAWSHHLKIRIDKTEAFLIDQAPSLNEAELADRLEWFAHRLPVFIEAFTHVSFTD